MVFKKYTDEKIKRPICFLISISVEKLYYICRKVLLYIWKKKSIRIEINKHRNRYIIIS